MTDQKDSVTILGSDGKPFDAEQAALYEGKRRTVIGVGGEVVEEENKPLDYTGLVEKMSEGPWQADLEPAELDKILGGDPNVRPTNEAAIRGLIRSQYNLGRRLDERLSKQTEGINAALGNVAKGFDNVRRDIGGVVGTIANEFNRLGDHVPGYESAIPVNGGQARQPAAQAESAGATRARPVEEARPAAQPDNTYTEATSADGNVRVRQAQEAERVAPAREPAVPTPEPTIANDAPVDTPVNGADTRRGFLGRIADFYSNKVGNGPRKMRKSGVGLTLAVLGAGAAALVYRAMPETSFEYKGNIAGINVDYSEDDGKNRVVWHRGNRTYTFDDTSARDSIDWKNNDESAALASFADDQLDRIVVENPGQRDVFVRKGRYDTAGNLQDQKEFELYEASDRANAAIRRGVRAKHRGEYTAEMEAHIREAVGALEAIEPGPHAP